MDLGPFLLHLLVVLVAARLAAEFAERIHQPAVVAEIAAGILIGPSVLGWVGDDGILPVLGELGAILLLFEVGMHMDLRELGRVGRSSLQVAAIGVAVPLALGFAGMRALGVDADVAVFLAAGITATSVGITARVFADLRALASTEARTVLGAAVADDVAGLLILTVVARVATDGRIEIASVAGIMVVALAFVACATAAGVVVAPRMLGRIAERARTDGTLMALGLGFALALAGLASAARLAPVVGAFVAGLTIARSSVRDELHRRLLPVGHLFIPIFFLQIGIDTRLRAFGDPAVLRIAAVLCAIAVAGKLASGLGVTRGSADRLLVGVGMVPRGEVGLIFASFGLARGLLDARSHAALVLVVLVTTLLAPPWLRRRLQRARRRAVARASIVEPPEGWLRITPDEVELTAEPPASLAPRVGLEAAVACAGRRPGTGLLRWLADGPVDPPVWDAALRERLFALLREGGVRSWRFLEVSGLLAHVLPDLDAALRRRMRDPFDLDPAGALRWDVLEDLKALLRAGHDPAVRVWERVEGPDLVLLAALARSVFQDSPAVGTMGRRFAEGLGLREEEAETLGILLSERHLLPAAAARLDMGTEESVLELAAHLGSRARADALYVLAVAEGGMEPSERERLDELFQLVQDVLAHPELTGARAADLVERRRLDAIRALAHLPEPAVRRYLEAAPRRYLLAQSPTAIARHLRMVETRPVRFEVRVHADPGEAPGEWIVHVVLLDGRGVLAAIAGGFASRRVSVQDAFVSTWRTGIAIDVFRVTAPREIDWEEVRDAIAGALAHGHPDGEPPAIEGTVEIDNRASPWHTIVEVRARDRTGLLYRVASALSRAGANIHLATVTTRDGIAVDSFFVTGGNGAKLDAAGERDLRLAFAGKMPRRWRMPRRMPRRKERTRVTLP